MASVVVASGSVVVASVVVISVPVYRVVDGNVVGAVVGVYLLW